MIKVAFNFTMREFLVRTGLMPLLTRTGLRGPLSTMWRVARRPQTIGHELALLADYWSFRRRYGSFLAEGSHLAEPVGKVLIVSLTDWVAQVKTEGLLAKGLQLRGYTPAILTYRWCKRALDYYRAFGIDQFVFFDDYIRDDVPASIVAEAEAFLSQRLTIQAIKKFQYRGVNVGRQVLASITRGLHRSVDLSDPALVHLLRLSLPHAMQAVLAAEVLFDHVQPQMALFLDKDYMGIGAIYDTAVSRGINTIQWCGSQRDDAYTLKRYTPEARNVHPQSLSAESWELVRQMPWTNEHERELMQEFGGRYKEGRWTSYYNRPYGRLKTQEEIQQELGLDPNKKTAVVFSHILWDSTFFWGEDLFDDYAEWFVETVHAACATPTVNWIVKLHPANAWKLERDGATGELYDRVILNERIGELPKHVKILDPQSDINTFSLFEITDYCLTVRGTAGVEMAALGVPVFTAGTGRYSGLGFTIDSNSREEYLAKLARIQEFPKLAAEQTELAKKYAYAIFNLRPWRFSTFELVCKPIKKGGHPLDHNVVIHADSFRDIAEAPDLKAFAEWAIDSRQLDFMSLDPIATTLNTPALRGQEFASRFRAAP